MIPAVHERLRCPLCRGALSPAPNALRCPSGHSFDVARQGYVNLLTGAAPAGAETAEMVAARADLLGAGHLDPVVRLVASAAAAQPAGSGLVVDVGAGTGYYLSAVLDQVPGRFGLALDIAKAAVRRAARAHPRAAAAVCDVWRGLPLADGSADVVLDVFAPRNGPEFRRVLAPTGRLIVVTPRADHLAELVGPLGLIGVDPEKDVRLDKTLGAEFDRVDAQPLTYGLELSRTEAARFVAMGPNAWHAEPRALAATLAEWDEPLPVTASVTVRTYLPR